MDRYIYHTFKIKAKEGYTDSEDTIKEWINSDPYPGYELHQLNLTCSGHQSVWKLKETILIKDIVNLLKKYKKEKIDLINPDNIEEWDEIGFDEVPDGYKDINDYLESDPEGELGHERTIELEQVNRFINELKNLLGEEYG